MIRRIELFGSVLGSTEALAIGEVGPGMHTGESFMSMFMSIFKSMFTSIFRFTLRFMFMLTLGSFFVAVPVTTFSGSSASFDSDCELHVKLESFVRDIEEVRIFDLS